MFEALERCMRLLPHLSKEDVQQLEQRIGFPSGEGGVDDAIAAFRSFLENDHQVLLDEEDPPYQFDYLLDEYVMPRSPKAVHGIAIHVRLTPFDSRQGRIMYGPSVFRLTDARYCWWVDNS